MKNESFDTPLSKGTVKIPGLATFFTPVALPFAEEDSYPKSNFPSNRFVPAEQTRLNQSAWPSKKIPVRYLVRL